MWTITKTGFYSAVQHNTDTQLVVVRTRVKADAVVLRGWYKTWLKDAGKGWPKPRVTSYQRSDYPWRVIMPRAAWADYLATAALDIDYGNFKSKVAAVQGAERAHVYSKVWSALIDLEENDRVKPAGHQPTWAWAPPKAKATFPPAPPLPESPEDPEYDPTEFDAAIKLECGCTVDLWANALANPCRTHQAPPF